MPIQVKIGEESLTGRSVGAIYADLTAALKKTGLWDRLDYFKISLATIVLHFMYQ